MVDPGHHRHAAHLVHLGLHEPHADRPDDPTLNLTLATLKSLGDLRVCELTLCALFRERAQRQELHLAQALRLVQAEILEHSPVGLGKRGELSNAIPGEHRREQLQGSGGLGTLQRLHRRGSQ